MAEFKDEDFTVDPTDVEAELCRMGALLLQYGRIEAELRLQVERNKAALERLYADTDTKIRADAQKNGEKITEAIVKNRVVTDSAYQAALDAKHEWEKQHHLARWAMDALSAKKDCVVGLNYRERTIMRGPE